MSPKKRGRRKTRRPDTGRPATDRTRTEEHTAPGRISRTPVTVADPPDRRITALWVAAALLWALGTPLALANLLFTVMDLQEAALQAQDPAAPLPQHSVDTVGNALVWVLALALAVPAAAAATALVLRRRIAAIGFTAALAVSALPLLWVMPPTELWDALSTHLLGT